MPAGRRATAAAGSSAARSAARASTTRSSRATPTGGPDARLRHRRGHRVDGRNETRGDLPSGCQVPATRPDHGLDRERLGAVTRVAVAAGVARTEPAEHHDRWRRSQVRDGQAHGAVGDQDARRDGARHVRPEVRAGCVAAGPSMVRPRASRLADSRHRGAPRWVACRPAGPPRRGASPRRRPRRGRGPRDAPRAPRPRRGPAARQPWTGRLPGPPPGRAPASRRSSRR